MKKTTLLSLVFCALIFVRVFAQPIFVPSRNAVPRTEILDTQAPEARVQAVFSSLLLAIENTDYPRFDQAITINLRAQMDKDAFTQMYGALGTRLERGYRIVFMGELNKPGLKTFVYKLVFKDIKGEVLTTISFNVNKEGKLPETPELKAAGFHLH